jgi:hypothetical protein
LSGREQIVKPAEVKLSGRFYFYPAKGIEMKNTKIYEVRCRGWPGESESVPLNISEEGP